MLMVDVMTHLVNLMVLIIDGLVSVFYIIIVHDFDLS